MHVPHIVKLYFDADSRGDADAVIGSFKADAVVEDEGARHQGAAAIRKWWSAARTTAQYTAEPLDCAVDGDDVVVRARVSGPLPGSPVTLSYAFRVESDKIFSLEIR